MSAHFNDRTQTTARGWAPRTADLDSLSTSDIREDHTSDLGAVRTHDVNRPPRTEDAAASRVFTPLVQPATAVTSDLDRRQEVSPTRELALHGGPTSAPRGNGAGNTPHSRPASSASEQKRLDGVSPGAVLKDRYLIEKALGAGGTAWVFRARDLSVQKDAPDAHIAIKTPRPDVKDSTRAIARLQHEFRHVHGLEHPNIARVLELDCDDETWFMTMELIQGRSLATLIREPASLPVPLKRTVLISCAEALAYAHSKDVVHGDFKPANVLVSASGQVKVFDFGAATSPAGEDTRIPAGTPAYASPQVLSGTTPDPRDDVFSFACVAYELLTGRHPFDRLSSLEAREQGKAPPRISILPAPQWLVLLSALAWEREERPSDIDKFARMIASDVAPATSAEPTSEISIVEPQALRAETNEEIAQPQRSWGFFAFLACALGLMFIGTQRQQTETSIGTGSPEQQVVQRPDFQIAPAGLMGAPVADASHADGKISGASLGLGTSDGGLAVSGVDERAAEATTEIAPAEKRTRAPVSEISFESASIATSESSLAAVFVIKRSAPDSHRVQIRWRAVSGTAEAGVDFASDAMGTVEFLDGQTQRAIYVPLRNDVAQEGEETFSIELEIVRGGRLANSTAQATILDDD